MILSVNNVSKSLNEFELKDISLELSTGEVLLIIGPNGAGKSTLINLLTGLIKPDEGYIKIFGKELKDIDISERMKIGVIGETLSVFENLTVKTYLNTVAYLYPDWDYGKMSQLLEKYQIDKKKKLRELSKGTRIKLDFIRIFAHPTEILFLDEPFSGLDLNSKKDLFEIFFEMKRLNRTIIISTHLIDDIDRYCDRLLILKNGKVYLNEKVEILESGWTKVDYAGEQSFTKLFDIFKMIRNGNSTMLLIKENYNSVQKKISMYDKQIIRAERITLKELISLLFKE